MTRRCGAAVVLAALAATLASAPATGAPAGTVTTIPLHSGGQPQMVVTGSDGNLWVTIGGTAASAIARVTTAGTVRLFNTPTAAAGPDYIAAGPDGALWFTEDNAAKVGRITTAGAIKEFPIPAVAQSIAGGFDGNVWATEPSAGKIVRITPTGAVTSFTPPGGIANIITRGPDGALWYTGNSSNKIGRIDSTGNATEFSVNTAPANITTGRDGALWFTQFSAQTIGHITTAGAVQQFTTPSGVSPTSITLGPDGLIWYGLFGKVGRMDVGGQVAEFTVGNGPLGRIGSGPDDAVYAPDTNNDALLRVDAGSPDPVIGKSVTAAPVSGTVLVKTPGSTTFVALAPGQPLPVGTIVDARHARVRLFATSGGKTYSADFYEGEFQITQLAKAGAPADLKLIGGNFNGCPKGVRAAAAKKKSIRHLWGEGSGNFRTLGRFSSAGIRGTTWLTDDQCTGTLTKVTVGKVLVRDFVKRKNVIVTAGHQYLAAARRR